MAISINTLGATTAVVSASAPNNNGAATKATSSTAVATVKEPAAKPKIDVEEISTTPSVQDVRAAAAEVSQYIDTVSRSLQISVDGELDRPIVTVIDGDTEAVIRQIPAEEIVAIARFLKSQGVDMAGRDSLSGILINQKG
jgi:flagellar protein FlaG